MWFATVSPIDAASVVGVRPTDKRAFTHHKRAADSTITAAGSVFCHLLKTAGHTATDASDGIEALRAAERTPSDLIIGDILMPTVGATCGRALDR
jgi:hypothetical protein